MLKKEFNYLEKFSELPDDTFDNSEEKVKYFGIGVSTSKDASKNVEILFYNSNEDFAIKLKTKENEEIILYKTTGIDKSFEENYNDIQEFKSKYNGEKVLQKADVLKIPYISVNDSINYDELCGRIIKETNTYISQAVQTIEFNLNNIGGNVKSEAVITGTYGATQETRKEFILNTDFILYLKEESKDKPYFALKVNNTDVLVKKQNRIE